MQLFQAAVDHLRLEVVSAAFLQLLLITIRDVLNGFRLSVLTKSREELAAQDKDALCRAAGEVETLFTLLQYCVMHDQTRFLLSHDFVTLLLGFYQALVDGLKLLPMDMKAVDYLKVFYYVTQGVCAVGALLSLHVRETSYISESHSRVLYLIKEAILTVNSEANLINQSETQFVFLSAGSSFCLPLQPSQKLDLAFILLVDLYNLAQGSPLLPDICDNLLRVQLKSLSNSFLLYRQIEGQTAELFCLFDKYLIVLHFYQSLNRLSRFQALLSTKDLLCSVMMSCCWYFVKWECPLYRESFKQDDGRLGKLYELLLSVFECCVGSQEEKLPLEFFAGLPEYIESDYTTVCEDRPGVLQTYTLELINEYLQKSSKALRLVAESSLLSLLLTPFFQLVPTVLQSRPFDIAELPTTENLAQLCSSYLTQTLQLVLKHKEGKVLFLQEFIKGFQQYKSNLAYISKLGRLMSEMVSNEDKEWVDLLAEMHLVDYIFQVVIDSKTLTEAPASLKPLQVTITSMLRIPQLAANLLQQKVVIKRLEQLLESEECAEFCMEVMARLLASNASAKFYRRFVRLLHRERRESVVEFLFQSIEVALSAKEDRRRESQRLFIESQALEVAMKRLEDFQSLRFLSIALAAIRMLLLKSPAAQLALSHIGFQALKSSILAALSPCPSLHYIESLTDNLTYILYDSADTLHCSTVKVPEAGQVLLEVGEKCGEVDIQRRLLEAVSSTADTNGLQMSAHGMLRPTLNLIVSGQSREVRSKAVDLAGHMAKQHFHPSDLLLLFQLLNNDSKESNPSETTTDLLALLKTAFASATGLSGCFFSLTRQDKLECRSLIPKKHGLTVFLWVKLSPSGLNNTLFTLSNRDNSKVLSVTVAVNSLLYATYTVKGTVISQCQVGLFPYNSLNMLSLTCPVRSPLKKVWELQVTVNGELQQSEGKWKGDEEGFECFTVGSAGQGEGLEGLVGCCGVFEVTFSEQQMEEFYRRSLFSGCYADYLYDYQVSQQALRLGKVKDYLQDLVIFLHPAYTLEQGRAINLVQRVSNLKTPDLQFIGVGGSMSESFVHPSLMNVKTVTKISVEQSFACIGGPKLLFPLLKRIDKPQYRKPVLHPILEIVGKVLSSILYQLEGDLSNGQLILTLQLLLEKLSRRITFKTSTALLIIDLKERLCWSKPLQMLAVEALILNPKIWDLSKMSTQMMLVSVINEALYTTPAEKTQLVSLIVKFCLCVAEPSSQTLQRKDFLRKAAELIKAYTIDSEESDYQPYVSELLRNIVLYEPLHAHIVHLLLKIISFFAKRGKVKCTEDFLNVMLYLVRRDSDGARNYSKRTLQILKMACLDPADSTVKHFNSSPPETVFTFLSYHLKRSLNSSEYQAVLSLMLSIPELRPKQTCWSTRYPELPYKDCYKDLVSEHKKIIIRYPQVLELLVSRLVGCARSEVMEDLALLVEGGIREMWGVEGFPEWLIAVWRKMELLDGSETCERLKELAVKVFSQGLLVIESAAECLRSMVSFLCTERKDFPFELSDFLHSLLTSLLCNPTVLAHSEQCRRNLPALASIFEDAVCCLKSAEIDLDPNLAVAFVSVMKTGKMLQHTLPPIPEINMSELIARYKLDSKKSESREGGIARVAIKTTFQLFRSAHEEALGLLCPVLMDIIDSLALSHTTNEVLNRGKRPIDDLLREKQFLLPLLFSELSDLLIARRAELVAVKAIEAVLYRLGDRVDMLETVEALAACISLDCLYDVKRAMVQFGVLALGAKPKTAARLGRKQHSWEDLEAIKRNLQKVTSALRPAFKSREVARVLLSEDWIEAAHPFLVIYTAGRIGFVDTVPQFQRSSHSPHSDPALAVLHSIDSLQKETEFRAKEKARDFLYAKAQWRQYYKWQSREAGVWAGPSSASFVWKVDPELDLEYKSTRLRKMTSRTRGYYTDKAHKKTALLGSAPVFYEKRGSVSPSRGCTTLAPVCEDVNDFAEVLRSRSPSTPSPAVPKLLEPMDPIPSDTTFECERIQPKGASFGSLEVSAKYCLFESARRSKGCDSKYVASALVLVT